MVLAETGVDVTLEEEDYEPSINVPDGDSQEIFFNLGVREDGGEDNIDMAESEDDVDLQEEEEKLLVSVPARGSVETILDMKEWLRSPWSVID